MDEEYLVSQSKKGDKNAFSLLIEIYEDRLYKTAWGMLQDSEDASDALQNCVLKAYLSMNSLRNDLYFKYWINRILINSCCDILRHRKKVIYMQDVDGIGVFDAYDDSTLDVRDAMGKLEEKYRWILSLRYYEDLSYEEISETLSCPIGTVKSRLNFALKKLREAMNVNSLTEVEK